MIKPCCVASELFFDRIKRFNLKIGQGEISGSVDIYPWKFIQFSDGWNDIETIMLNYCPWCGKLQERP